MNVVNIYSIAQRKSRAELPRPKAPVSNHQMSRFKRSIKASNSNKQIFSEKKARTRQDIHLMPFSLALFKPVI